MASLPATLPEELSALSVDEIFSKKSIVQLRNIQQIYHASVKLAKHDLHSLVGKKYRDLIRIAEDIDEMNLMAKQIDEGLMELSYKTPRFVSFEKNNYALFESRMRAQEAQNARQLALNTIFNNIINTKIVAFDVTLQKKELRNTRTLVRMARMHHVLSAVFKDTLRSTPLSNSTFKALRQNFIDYLEAKIASSVINDSTGQFLSRNLFVASSPHGADSSSSELFAEHFEDEENEPTSDSEDKDLPGQRGFDIPAPPIVNYLAAYIILRSSEDSFNSMESIAERVLAIRFEHLEAVFQESANFSTNQKKLNFAALLMFIQSSFIYVSKHLASTDSQLFQLMAPRDSTWKVSQMIGFSKWFQNDVVSFHASSYAALSKERFSTLEPYLEQYTKFVVTAFKYVSKTSRNDEIADIKHMFDLFASLVSSLKQIDSMSFTSPHLDNFKQHFLDTSFIEDIISHIANFIKTTTQRHQEHIVDNFNRRLEEDLLMQSSPLEPELSYFSNAICDLVELDVGSYFEHVLQLASVNDPKAISRLEEDITSILKLWYTTEIGIMHEVNPEYDGSLKEILQLLHLDIHSDSPAHESISPEFISAAFKTTHSQLLTSTKDVSAAILESTLEKLASLENPPLCTAQYFLHILLTLKQSFGRLPDADDLMRPLQTQLELATCKVFECVSRELLDDSSSSLHQILLRSQWSSEKDNQAHRPSMAVHSAVEHISAELLKPSVLRLDELHFVYLNSVNKKHFVQVKNDWLSKLANIYIETVTQSATKATDESDESGVGENEDGEVQTLEVQGTQNADETVEVPEVSEELEKTEEQATAEDNREGESQEEESQVTPDEQVVAAGEDASEKQQGGAAANGESSVEDNVDTTESPTKEAGETESTLEPTSNGHTLTSTQMQLLADVVFLVALKTDGSFQLLRLELEPFLEQILGSQFKLDDLLLDQISRGVGDVYKTSKDIYLPLLEVYHEESAQGSY